MLVSPRRSFNARRLAAAAGLTIVAAAPAAAQGAAALPPEPAMLVLVGSGLLGLAFIVNTTRRT